MSHKPAAWNSPRSMLAAFTIAICLALAAAACNQSEATPTPPAVEPATPTPTATPFTIPEATATAAATPTPAPVSTPTQTNDDDETQALLPSDLTTYTDDLYDYRVDVPENWTGTRPETGSASIVTVFDVDDADIEAKTIVLFTQEEANPAELAREQINALAGTSGFRTITEAEIVLEDGATAHQVIYGYGTGSNEHRGSLTFVSRGTIAMGMHLEAPRTIYERNFDLLESISTSIRPVDADPFGAPADETLVLYLDRGPLTLDPGISTDAGSSQYIRQIFSGLVRLNPDLIPEEDLATWDVSDDGTVYTFTIKDDAQFHNGDPVTAQDVIFSWERALNRNLPPVGGSAAAYLDDIVGAKAYADGTSDSVEGLEAVSDSILRVTIDEPKSYFLSKLSHTAAYIVLRSNVPEVPSPRLIDDEQADNRNSQTAEDDEDSPPDPWYFTAIGTGPYRLAHFQRGRAAHLTAFDEYVGTPQSVANLVFRFHAGLPIEMVKEGFVDATTLIAIPTYEDLKEENSPLVNQITKTDALSIQYLAFNTTTEPFDDPDVRRAFLKAVDRQTLFDEHGLSGLTTAHGFMPPGLPGYDENIEDIEYDPVAAKRLLDSTAFGQRDEEERVILIAGSGNRTDLDTAIFRQWQDNLGVRISYQGIGAAYFYALPQILANDVNIYEYGWLADYPDPHNFLDVLFHTESPNNDGKAGSAQINALLEAARTAGEDRLEQYRIIERKMVEEAVAIPLYFGSDLILVSERVKNLTVDAQGHLRVENVDLDG